MQSTFSNALDRASMDEKYWPEPGNVDQTPGTDLLTSCIYSGKQGIFVAGGGADRHISALILTDALSYADTNVV